jgi:hypothetical protein
VEGRPELVDFPGESLDVDQHGVVQDFRFNLVDGFELDRVVGLFVVADGLDGWQFGFFLCGLVASCLGDDVLDVVGFVLVYLAVELAVFCDFGTGYF